MNTYNLFGLYNGQLCTYCIDRQHNPGLRNPNEVWDTMIENSGVDIVRDWEGVKFVHFRPRVSESTEVAVDLVLQQLLQRRESLPVMEVNCPYADRPEVPRSGVIL